MKNRIHRNTKWPIVCILLVLCGNGYAQKHYRDIKAGELSDIQLPEVTRVTLDNGMKLFLLEDRELPLINVSAMIRVGSIFEPPDKIGLAAITGDVMRTGGTKGRTGDELDELLESLAATVETGIGQSSGSAVMSVLKQDLDIGLAVLADVLMRPTFGEDKLELAKIQQRSVIARRNDDPGGIARREFRKLIYGPQSFYARHAEYETISNISRDDVVAFHGKYYQPANVLLGVWGDFDSQKMLAKISAAFKDWRSEQITLPEIADVVYDFPSSVNLITKDDVNQTNIFMGHLGGRRDSPDYFAQILANRILGQGLSSRLTREVRSRLGLAYSVFGSFIANYDHPGLFFVGCQTKSETTVQAIRAIRKEIAKMTRSEVTDEELALAKSAYLNSFVFNFDSKREIVERLLTFEYYGYPPDFLAKTKENIERVTKEDILRVAQKNLHPDNLQILAVGKPADFDEPLSVFGELREIDITIPIPLEEAPEATDETLAKGRMILNQSIDACGGKMAFKAIRTIEWQGRTAAVLPQGGEMDVRVKITIAFPDRVRIDYKLPMGEMSQILNGKTGWLITAQGENPAPSQMTEQMISNLWRNLPYLFSYADAKGLTAQYIGSAKAAGRRCEVILITPQGQKSTRLFIDSETRMPLKMTYQGANMMGAPVATEELLSDFRETAGVMVPFKSVSFHDGKKALDVAATEIKINQQVSDSLFALR